VLESRVVRVLVIGGTEFIGLHVLRALVRDGHDATVLNRGRRMDRLPAGIGHIVADRKDHAALRERLRGQRFDAVVDVTYAPTLGEDVAALADALEGQPHVVFVSSARVYDHALPIPYSEDTPRGFYWGDYARHKIAGEDALLERHRARGLPVTIVRPTHVMGPLNTRHNETFFMDRIHRGRPVLVPGHGGWLRQFGHVEDLADTMVGLLGNPRAAGQAYNVTGEETVTQVGFVEVIAEAMGRDVRLVPLDAARLGEVAGAGPLFGQNLLYECHAVHTTHKVRAELGARPRYTLAQGLRHTWQWYRAEGLHERPVDFGLEDRLLAKLHA
jgi:nucleoside-diphosphate-sugar epimerase